MEINLQESIKSVEKAIGCLVETVFDNGSLKEMSVGGFIDAKYNAKLNGDLLASNIVENEFGPRLVSYDADMLNDDDITPSIPN
jgi:hypothetical protein